MPCYHPLPAWYAPNRELRPGRTLRITFRPEPDHLGTIDIPCGRCIGCRLERSRQWALRCMHEAQLYQHNAFVTLTYDNNHLPPGGSLQPRDYVLFMKRLRKAQGPGVRFFQCGEYGERLERPHHHALLFNCRFHDQRQLARTGTPLYQSDQLNTLWGNGIATIGHVTFDAAAYVARYTLKKITGPPAAAHYQGRVPEYGTMSRRPGIGSAWLQRFRTDVYPDDRVIIRGGIQCRPPRFYDDKQPSQLMKRLKLRRRLQQRDNPDNTGKRLIVRETVTTAAIATFTERDYQ